MLFEDCFKTLNGKIRLMADKELVKVRADAFDVTRILSYFKNDITMYVRMACKCRPRPICERAHHEHPHLPPPPSPPLPPSVPLSPSLVPALSSML